MVSWLSGCRYDGGLCEVTRVSQSSGGNGCGRAGFHSRQAGSFYSLPPPSSVPSSLLTTLRLDFSMGDWADALADAAAMATEAAAIPSSKGDEGETTAAAAANKATGAACRSTGATSSTTDSAIISAFTSASPTSGLTPLAPLRHACSLLYLDLMLVDSSEGSEGLLDDRLIEDLAALERLEEVCRGMRRGGWGRELAGAWPREVRGRGGGRRISWI